MTDGTPFEIPPGVVAKPTKKMNSSNWSEAHLIRWKEGTLQPVGGQTRINYNPLDRARKIHTWMANDGVVYIAYLCDEYVFVDLAGTLYDITPTGGMEGPADDLTAGGFGDDVYSEDDYGDARDPVEAIKVITPCYSLDNWGEDLVIMTSTDSRLLRWKPSDGVETESDVVPNAPTGRCFVVTPERHVLIFGPDGVFNEFAWCDQEDIENWEFDDPLSTAGTLPIEPSSPTITACKTKDGVIMFTAKKAHIIRYIGVPYIYSIDDLAEGVTPWSPQSVSEVVGQTIWMTSGGVYLYDGGSVQPVPCSVRDWVDDDIDPRWVRYDSFSVHLPDQSEWWWFFPQRGERYNTRCIIFNYRDGWWSQGRMARSAGTTGVFTSSPIMADGVEIYQHETGELFPDVDPPWIESFNLNIASGARLSTITHLFPDIDGDADKLSFYLYHTMDRSGKTAERMTTGKKVRSNGFIDFRTKARDFRLRVASDGPDVGRWSVGQFLIEVVQNGEK